MVTEEAQEFKERKLLVHPNFDYSSIWEHHIIIVLI